MRKNPYDEGYLKQIAELFIKPLLMYKPKQLSLKEYLKQLFHVDTRTIHKYRVKRKFKMPGLYLERPGVKIQGIGHRDMKSKMMLWVRRDSTELDKIHIEFNGGVGNKDQVFELDYREWISIEPYIRKLRQ